MILPFSPYGGRTAGHQYSTTTWYQHLVSQYTGLDFHEVGQLDYIQYLIYRRDAFIYWLNQSEAGQKYLDEAWRMEQTETDRAALRKHFGKKEKPEA